LTFEILRFKIDSGSGTGRHSGAPESKSENRDSFSEFGSGSSIETLTEKT
jgi:hypothetical protein